MHWLWLICHARKGSRDLNGVKGADGRIKVPDDLKFYLKVSACIDTAAPHCPTNRTCFVHLTCERLLRDTDGFFCWLRLWSSTLPVSHQHHLLQQKETQAVQEKADEGEDSWNSCWLKANPTRPVILCQLQCQLCGQQTRWALPTAVHTPGDKALLCICVHWNLAPWQHPRRGHPAGGANIIPGWQRCRKLQQGPWIHSQMCWWCHCYHV